MKRGVFTGIISARIKYFPNPSPGRYNLQYDSFFAISTCIAFMPYVGNIIICDGCGG
jgi:hypothetical protein